MGLNCEYVDKVIKMVLLAPLFIPALTVTLPGTMCLLDELSRVEL